MVVEAVTQDPLDLAWRIHGALTDWTGKVDTKASFALTLESATAGAVIALSGAGGALGSLQGGWPLWSYRVGVAALGLALLFSASAVIPRTRWRALKEEWSSNFVFFGHLRYWSQDELVRALSDADPMPAMAQQLVAMSRIAWWKHVAVQVSIVLAFVGAAAFVLAA